MVEAGVQIIKKCTKSYAPCPESMPYRSLEILKFERFSHNQLINLCTSCKSLLTFILYFFLSGRSFQQRPIIKDHGLTLDLQRLNCQILIHNSRFDPIHSTFGFVARLFFRNFILGIGFRNACDHKYGQENQRQ